MEPFEIQNRIFERIKQQLPSSTSFVDELAFQLDISNDSAYRRIRGEKMLTLEELIKLGEAYHISFDSMVQNQLNNITFNYRSINSNVSFEEYFDSILANLRLISGFEKKDLFYIAKDLPLFKYFDYRNIAAFKLFFWQKTILNKPELQHCKFDPSLIPNAVFETGKKIIGVYTKIPSTEVWNKETINSTLNQLEFYYDNGFLDDHELLQIIFDELKELVLQVKIDAENGYKTSRTYPSTEDKDNFKLYYNEVTIGDNTIFFDMGDRKMAFITHNVLNLLTTSNPEFCNETHNVLRNIIKKSNLISLVSQKQRNNFFNCILQKIEVLEKKLLTL
ncbi:MAG: hypothetical protein KDC58_02220 [Cyclobacteriaceae bacterium]|nr:hypothetical protein [Cyclobacteriaceae bacterium]